MHRKCCMLTNTPLSLCSFITVRHDPAALQRMNKAFPSVVAKDGARVIGYVIMMPREYVRYFPVLQPMLDMLDGITRRGVALRDNARWCDLHPTVNACHTCESLSL